MPRSQTRRRQAEPTDRPHLLLRPLRLARRAKKRDWIAVAAAFVGLMGIVAALFVQMNTQNQLRSVNAQLAELQAANTALKAGAAAAPKESAPTVDAIAQTNGVVDALLALQNRIAALEKGAVPAAAAPTDATTTGALDEAAPTADGAVDAQLPGLAAAEAAAALRPGADPTGPLQSAAAAGGEECIPVGTQFIVGMGDNYAVCGTGQSVKVTAVSDQQIVLAQGGAIPAGGNGPFGDKCRVNVNSITDGFARLRVTCS